MIDVYAGALEVRRLPRLAAVGAPLDVDVHRPDRVRAVRVGEDLVVILRAAAAIAVVVRQGRAAAPAELRSCCSPLPPRPAPARPPAARRRRPAFASREGRARGGASSLTARPSGVQGSGGAACRTAPRPRPPRPAAGVCRPMLVHELPPSSERKKPDSGRFASTSANTVEGSCGRSIGQSGPAHVAGRQSAASASSRSCRHWSS